MPDFLELPQLVIDVSGKYLEFGFELKAVCIFYKMNVFLISHAIIIQPIL